MVVDASVAVKWLIREVLSPEALELLQFWADQQVAPLAPYLLPVEVANALYRRATAGDIGFEEALRLVDSLAEARVRLVEPSGLHRRAMELARTVHQSAAYDCHYLALAETVDCEMWTADDRFQHAASAVSRRVRRLADFPI